MNSIDYIAGTSTGGSVACSKLDLAVLLTLSIRLIAMMLSRWRMSAGECRKQYEDLGMAIFANPRPFSFLGIPYDKHHKAPLVQAIENIMNLKIPEEHRDANNKLQKIHYPKDLCRV
jgi:hypothetical protein